MQKLLFVLLVGLIALRYFSTRPDYKQGDHLVVTGRVLREPIYYDDSQFIFVENVAAYVERFPEISYGDSVAIEGVYDDGKIKKAKLIDYQQSSSFLFKTRKRLVDFYKQLPEPDGSLVAGMVIGSRAAMPDKFWEALKKTGTAHVVVASGMNVTLVSGFLINGLVGTMKRGKAVILAIVGVWVYTILAGFEAPLVRAAIMGTIAFSAQSAGKLYDALRALIISAAVMLLFNPNWLGDLGFILSFVATGSLMLFENKISRLIHFVPAFLREGLSTSLAAQIGVAPILYWQFGAFSPWSPLINALILWTVPYITIIGGASGVLSLLIGDLALFTTYLVYPLTQYFIAIINLFA